MSQRYSSVAIGLHWVIALLLVGNIFLGWNMEDAEHRAIESLFQLHKSIGITVLFLSLIRLAWRLMNPAPALPSDIDGKEKLASHIVHWLFYVLMIGIPLTGWILVSASKFSVSTVLFGVVSWPHLPFLPELSDNAKNILHGPVEFFHSKGAWLFLILLVLHVAGAVKHELSSESGVLKRMLPGLFGKTTAPQKSKGALIAFGGGLLLFVAIASVPLLSSFGSGSSNAGESTSRLSSNWSVDYAASEITFSGTHDGNAFNGRFGEWTADIQFDENKLNDSQAVITVSTGSATTSKKLYTDTLKAAEWFAPSSFSQAIVTLSNFQAVEGAYIADAVINLKDTELKTQWAFTLEPADNGQTIMNGSTTVDRTKLDLGLKSDPSGNWVSINIDIQAKVVATPVK